MYSATRESWSTTIGIDNFNSAIMGSSLSQWIFILCTFGAAAFLYSAIDSSKEGNEDRKESHKLYFVLFVTVWLSLQGLLSYVGFYAGGLDQLPPRIVLFGVLPNVLFIFALFYSKAGRRFIDRLSLKELTLLHTIRIPVEIGLFLLAREKAIPTLMTFEGMNFDILAGLSAPIIYYFFYVKNRISRAQFMLWNVLCVMLLANIVFIGLLSAPSPIQAFSFEQPNVGILHFPYAWLPTFIVPIVLFAHLVAFKKLIKR